MVYSNSMRFVQNDVGSPGNALQRFILAQAETNSAFSYINLRVDNARGFSMIAIENASLLGQIKGGGRKANMKYANPALKFESKGAK